MVMFTRWLPVAVIGLSFLLMWPAGAGAAAKVKFSAPVQSVKQGQTVKVDIVVDTGGDALNALQLNVAFPADKLSMQSVSYAGSAFDIKAEETSQPGLLRIARGSVTPKSGKLTVASVVFRAVAATKLSVVKLADGSALVRAADHQNVLEGPKGPDGTYAAGAARAGAAANPASSATAGAGGRSNVASHSGQTDAAITAAARNRSKPLLARAVAGPVNAMGALLAVGVVGAGAAGGWWWLRRRKAAR